VAKLFTVLILTALGSINNWHIHQLSANNVFIHVDLDEGSICRFLGELLHLFQAKFASCTSPCIVWFKPS